MTTSKAIIGRIIKQQREESGLTLQQFADLLGVDRQYVWRLENGRINMTLDYLDKVIGQLKSKKEVFFTVNNKT